MSAEERTVFASTVLVEKPPAEASNIFLSRLLESKGLNNQIGSFLFDYMQINRHYANKLKKILDTKGKDLNQSIDQYVKKESKHDGKYANAKSLGTDHLGDFNGLWQGIVDDIHEEIFITEQFCNSMEKQLISPLKKCFDINKNKKYSNMLSNILELSEIAEAESPSNEWAIKSPEVSEQFENFEYNRLLFLKDVFISFQNNSNYRFNENLKHNENLFSVLVSFNPDEEITRFANSVTNNEAATTAATKPLPEIASTAKKIDKRDTPNDHIPIINRLSMLPKSKNGSSNNTLTNNSHHNSNSNTVAEDLAAFQPPLQTTKSNPSTINSQITEKRRSGLRSKMGTLFGGRKKNKNTKHQLSDSITEDFTNQAETREEVNKDVISNVVDNSVTRNEPLFESPKNDTHTISSPTSAPIKEDQKTFIPPVLEPRSSFLNEQIGGENLSINQKALTPKRNNTNEDMFENPVNNIFSAPISAPTANSSSSAAPPPPPTRKVSTNEGSSISSSSNNKRRDIQSKLFTGLTTATIMEQGKLGAVSNGSQERLSFIGEEKDISLPPLPKNAYHSIHEARKQSSVSDLSINNHHENASVLSLSQHSQLKGNKFVHTDLSSNGLNASICELLKVSMKDGYNESCQITGEIALTYFKPPIGQLPINGYFKIKDENKSIDRIVTNHSFLRDLENDNNDDKIYEINLAQISNRTVGGIKYFIGKAESPINIIPVWRYEEHQASCMIGVQLNEKILTKMAPNQSIALENFILMISLEEGVEISSAMSKPSGTYNKERRRITWKYTEPLILSPQKSEAKIVARFYTNGLARESKNGAQAKFIIKQGAELIVSDIELEYSEEHANRQITNTNEVHWEPVNSAKTFGINGFSAHSI